MKKRILALLLAGLLTTSLVSCVTTTTRPGDTSGNQTEPSQTQPNNPDNPVGPTDDPVIWNTVNETVYVIDSNLSMQSVNDANTTVKAGFMDELIRVKISTDGKRSVVEKNGVQYYVSSEYLDNSDLLGKNFTPCNKTMYAKGSVNVRTYASSQQFSPKIVTLKNNATVTVVAEGTSWSKIKYDETHYYFVFSENLSATELIDYDNVDYSAKFTACDETLYVTANTLTIRCNASVESSQLSYYFELNDQVKAIAKGTVDGTLWYKVLVPEAVQPGQTQTYIEGYITDKYVSTAPDQGAPTLESMLEQYPAFEELDEHLDYYVSNEAGSLNFRSSPDFPEGNKNVVVTLPKLTAVKLIATATIEDTKWAMVSVEITNADQTKETRYLFASYKYLTSNPTGEPALPTLAELIAKYNLTDIEDKAAYAIGDVLYNTTPSNPDASSTQKLTKNQKVTVVATGTASYAEWYLFQIEGDSAYYFAGAEKFSDTIVA